MIFALHFFSQTFTQSFAKVKEIENAKDRFFY
jgi:hypothetical protein